MAKNQGPASFDNDKPLEVPGPTDIPKGGDKLAERELQALWSHEHLVAPEYYARQKRIIRDSQLEDAVHWAVRLFVRFVAMLLVIGIGVWAFHILGKDSWRWLSPEDVAALQSLLFSGTIGTLAATIGHKVFRR